MVMRKTEKFANAVGKFCRKLANGEMMWFVVYSSVPVRIGAEGIPTHASDAKKDPKGLRFGFMETTPNWTGFKVGGIESGTDPRLPSLPEARLAALEAVGTDEAELNKIRAAIKRPVWAT